MPSVGLFIKVDNIKKVFDAVEKLTNRSVYVGYPQSGPNRSGTGEPTNAYLAFIHEHGAPNANIPARPFMIPGIISIRERIITMMKQTAILALQGEEQESVVKLNQLGFVAVAALQRAITRGEGWPPLSQRTLAARRRRGVRRTHPLIDTGQLRQHVEYVIRTDNKHVISQRAASLLASIIKRL